MTNIKKGENVVAQINGITKYGLFVSLEDNYRGLIHISEVSNKFIIDLNDLYKIGDVIKAKILEVDEEKLQVKLSIKKTKPLKYKKNVIKEKGEGYKILERNLNNWIEEKLVELEK